MPPKKVLEECKRGRHPEYWSYQVQHQLEVTQKRKAVILVYDAENPCESPIFEVERDEEIISEILEKEREFYECMINFDPPSIGKKELVERNDEEWKEAEEAWLKSKENLDKAKKALEEASELEKICKEGLVYLSNDKASKGQKIALLKSYAKGRIDYSRIPQLERIDVEPFRSPGYFYWRIKEI